MRYSTTASGLALAAIVGEVVAGPTHAHLHRKAHEKKDVDYAALDWDNMGIDWSSAWAAGQATKAAAATATASSSVAAATTSAAASSTKTISSASSTATDLISSIIDDVADLWEGLVGASNDLTSFGSATASIGKTGALAAGDNYQGNIGSPYGSNVIKVSSISGYDFTNKFINTASSGMTINIWQKVGPDGQILSGSALAPKNTTLTFYLAAGASQIVAIQDNTQIAWAEACSDFAASGAYATTWGEANFVSTGSGYDMSAIMNSAGNTYDMAISSTESDCISDMTQNYWLTATEPIGTSDGSCYVPDSTMHLTTKMGGVVSS